MCYRGERQRLRLADRNRSISEQKMSHFYILRKAYIFLKSTLNVIDRRIHLQTLNQ